jgi:Ca2+-binding RTX toxin-like protein
MAIYSGGSEIVVNTETLGYQSRPTITSLSSGGFVVSWEDSSGRGGDEDGAGIKAQIFDAWSAKVGSEFLVNTTTLFDQNEPAITSLSWGGFVISWVDGSGVGGDASEQGIKAQIFDGSGAKVGSEFLVNTQTVGEQGRLAVTSLASGGFVVSWQDEGVGEAEHPDVDVKAQVFDATGAKIGSEFLVNTESLSFQIEPSMATLSSGRFVVSWTDASGFFSGDGNGTEFDIKAQMFDASGAKVGSEFLVNTETSGGQGLTTISALASGGFVVAWADGSGRGGDADVGIKAQMFDASGAKVGSEFLVNTETLDTQAQPAVTSLSSGGFAIGWQDFSGQGGDATGFGIKAQIFDASGAKVGPEFLVNTTTADGQIGPAIVSLASSALVVAWEDYSGAGTDTSSPGIRARIFSVADEPINLSGTTGNDTLVGTDGNDTLSGGAGDDLLVGNAGNDRAYGGSGNDELDGGEGDDILSGSIGDDFAYGGAGDDLLAGGDGMDRLLGGMGDDRLNGGARDDVLNGGEGRDTLIGGAGKDTMTGGADPDHFLFMPGDSRPGGGVRDVITDFTSGEDVLDLRALGVTDFAAQVSTESIGSGIILHIDLDWDGFDYADFAVQLTGVSSLSVGDILI